MKLNDLKCESEEKMKVEWLSGQGGGRGKGLKVRKKVDETRYRREEKKWDQEHASKRMI